MSPLEQERVIQRELSAIKQSLAFGGPVPVKIQRVLDYLHQHLFEESLSVASALTACGIRSNNFHARFKNELQRAGRGRLTVRCYIEEARMRAAKRLLRHEELDLCHIAFSLGYRHYETFIRAFKRCTDCTPRKYRGNCQEESSGEQQN